MAEAKTEKQKVQEITEKAGEYVIRAQIRTAGRIIAEKQITVIAS